MKSLLFVISALAIFAGAQADFDAVAWCKSRATSRNLVQYKANPDNKNEYFQCEKTKSGIVAHKQTCQKCFEFSDDTWVCEQVSKEGCATEAPITEVITYDKKYCYVKGNGPAGLYLQLFAEGSIRYKYLWAIGGGVEIEVSCPPGTYFDFLACKCLWCDGGLCAQPSNRVFTLDFDNSAYQNGIYFDLDSAVDVLYDTDVSSFVAQFNGLKGDIEVPYFQNNEFSQFTFAASFKRLSSSGPQGILYNGGNPSVSDYVPPSIYIYSLSDSEVVAGIRTTDGVFQVPSITGLSAGVWYSIVLRYDGAKLELWIGDDAYSFVDATGAEVVKNEFDETLIERVTLRLKDDLKIGSSFDSAGTAQYFNGKLDNLSWYRTAIKVPIQKSDLPPN